MKLTKMTQQQVNKLMDKIETALSLVLPRDAKYVIIVGNNDAGYRGTESNIDPFYLPEILHTVASTIEKEIAELN